jgi:WD40 repeat protein
LLAVGTSSGRIVLLDASTFDFRGDVHAHDDEVHGLAFTSDHALLSAGFDGKLVVHALTPTDTGTARLATTTLKTGEVVWLSHLDGNRATPTVRDARQPSTLITRAAVQRLHLATLDGVTLPVHRPEGETTAPAVAVGHLRIAGLDVGEVRAAVCDTCVPPGAEIALGMDVLASLDVHEDIATNLLVLAAKPNGSAHAIAGLLALTPVRTIALPGPATDLDTSARGDVLVTFSHARAVRNFDLNQDEHHGKYPPASAQSGAALVDVEHGTLLRQFVSAHEGFTSSGAVSPDGRTVVTGGWDKRAIVFDAATGDVVTERSFAWLVRRVRFAPDGHLLAVAAWTPVNALNEGNSDPALLLYPVLLAAPHLHAP